MSQNHFKMPRVKQFWFRCMQHKIKSSYYSFFKFNSRIKGILRWLVKGVSCMFHRWLPGIQMPRDRVLSFDVSFHAKMKKQETNKLTRSFLVVDSLRKTHKQKKSSWGFLFSYRVSESLGIYFPFSSSALVVVC